jgi:hypothetical protein
MKSLIATFYKTKDLAEVARNRKPYKNRFTILKIKSGYLVCSKNQAGVL